MSPDVWLQLRDAPAGLTDFRGGVNGASPATSQKDALLSSKPNNPSAPSSPSRRGQAEVSTVSESVQEELSPPSQKAAPKEQSKPEPPQKKKDPVGENCQVQLFICLHQCPHLSLSRSYASSVFGPHLLVLNLCFYWPFSMLSSNTLSKSQSNVGLAFMHYFFILAMAKCLQAFLNEGRYPRS